ncbi:MAG: phenylacetate--CoA ligase [Clostridiales bacterium]|nr:phenylacetate--CoA ligase [Clostridiales bacterium]
MNYYDKQIECMPRSEMEVLQGERLVNLVKKVYDTVPLYRDKMNAIKLKPSDIKGLQDMHKLPFTEKQDLRNSYPYGMFAAPKKDIVRLHASSATTGKLTVVGYTKKDIDIWAEAVARCLVMTGANPESTIHIAYGYGLFTGGLGMHYGAEKLGATAVPVSSGNTQKQLQLLQDFQSEFLCCTPSYAVYLAESIVKAGMTMADFNLKAGIFGAEPWSEAMRNTIESKLKIKAYDIYGLSEICGPGVACECAEQSGMHINEDHYFPEIVDSDTLEPLGYNKTGELVFTTLTKEGIPLIRYRTFDLASLSDEKCKCGRTLVKLNKIAGRTDDMLIIRGVNVFPSQIESVLLNCVGVEPHYHIYVDRIDNLDTLEIHVEMSDKLFSDEAKEIDKLHKKLTNDMLSAIGVSAKIKLVSPHSLARSEGKAKTTTDRRKGKL